MIVTLLEEAVASAARRGAARACVTVGLSVRTVERWRGAHPQEARQGPRTAPANALTDAERADVLTLQKSPAYRDAWPHQIMPHLADTGVYMASELTTACYGTRASTRTAAAHRRPCDARCPRIMSPDRCRCGAGTSRTSRARCGPMKGATMLATLQRLGVIPFLSQPRLSDDHPYSEAPFRTLTHFPAFPT